MAILVVIIVGEPRGNIAITAEEVADSKFDISMQLSGSNLDKKDFFGKVSYMDCCWPVIISCVCVCWSFLSLTRSLSYLKYMKVAISLWCTDHSIY